MSGIIPRAWIPVLAILMIALIGIYAVISHAIIPLVIVGAIIITGVVAGIIGYWLGKSHADAAKVHEQHAKDVDLYTKNLISVYSNAWANIIYQMKDSFDLFFNNSYSYYARWGESIASTVCNENKTAISDDDLDPIIKDYTQIIKDHLSRILDSMYDLYMKAKALAGQRHNAGLDDSLEVFKCSVSCNIYWDGEITYGGGVLSKIIIEINGQELGYIDPAGNKYINETMIRELLLNGNATYNAQIILVTAKNNTFNVIGFEYYSSDGKYTYDYDIDIPSFINDLFINIKMMYENVKTDANTYCYIAATAGGQEIPPPSISLPYDYNTINKMDPLSRMQLYQTYLYYLSQTNWSKVQNLTADDINGLPDKSIKINGSIDIDGDGKPDYEGYFIPMNIPWRQAFNVNGTSGIAGIWYWYDPSARTMRIIKIEPQPVPSDYQILENLSNGQVLISYDNGTRRGVLVDVDGDGRYDYVVPYINVSSIKDVQYDRDNGEYKEFASNSTSVGPQNAKEWADRKLQEVGALPEINTFRISLPSLPDILGWWNSLIWKIKLLVIAAGALILILIISALGRSKVVVAK